MSRMRVRGFVWLFLVTLEALDQAVISHPLPPTVMALRFSAGEGSCNGGPINGWLIVWRFVSHGALMKIGWLSTQECLGYALYHSALKSECLSHCQIQPKWPLTEGKKNKAPTGVFINSLSKITKSRWGVRNVVVKGIMLFYSALF